MALFAWLILALGVALVLGLLIRARDGGGLAPCACGCGREIPVGSGWDGYHGPGPRLARPPTEPWIRDLVIATLPESIQADFRCSHREIEPLMVVGDNIEVAKCLLCGEQLTDVGRTVTEHAWQTGWRPGNVLPPVLVEGATPYDDFNRRAARGELGYGNHPYDF